MSRFWIRFPSFSSRILGDLQCEYSCQGNVKILDYCKSILLIFLFIVCNIFIEFFEQKVS